MSDENALNSRADACLLLARAFANVPDAETVLADFATPFAQCGNVEEALRLIASDQGRVRSDAGFLKAIRVDHTALCCGTALQSPLPYRSVYEEDGRLLKGSCCVGLRERYEAEGFVPSLTAPGEPEDHVSTLLEFAALLYREAARASTEAGDEVGAEGKAARAAVFLQENVGNWADRYCAEARAIAETDFCRGLLGLLQALCALGDRA